MAPVLFHINSSSNEDKTELLNKIIPPLIKQRNDFISYGRGYFHTLRKLKGNNEDINNNEKDLKENDILDKIIIPTNITINNLDQFSLYDVLGLGAWGSSVDVDTIKKAYHKAVLLYHPDKQQNTTACEEDARAIFLKIQEANTVLSDEDKRRAYDSQLDFDETIPSEEETKEASKQGIEAFCELYEPIFKLNARFAVIKPVPILGNKNTPISKVYEFYDYWIKFDSWRDFMNVNPEHNPDSATSREEKRWMIKENERIAKKLKKKEMSRINEFVMRAMEYDPRIIADKERVKSEKTALREARERDNLLKAQQEAAEEAKRIEEEAEKIRQQKAENESQKKFASKTRNIFRKLLKVISDESNSLSNQEKLEQDDIELLCQNLEILQLAEINESLGGEAAVKDINSFNRNNKGLVFTKLNEVKEKLEQAAKEEEILREERKKADQARARAADLKKKGLQRDWSREELSTLSKAIGRFPGGTKQRWVAVCNYMNEILKPEVPFEVEECMKATHNAMEHLAQMKEAGGIGGKVGTINSNKNTTTGNVPTFSTSSSTGAILTPPTPPTSTSSSSSSTTTTTSTSTTSPSINQNNSSPATIITNASAPSPPPPTSTSNNLKASSTTTQEDPDNDVWTQNQQQQLELGLKKYPASMDKAERWTKIASEVTGKSKKACINRYKYLREEIQAKKSQK